MERPLFERLIHVPGPNPIISTGDPGEWDDGCIEACNVLKDHHTYYFYYHGIPEDHDRWGPGSYRIGVAEATHPLGPWKKRGTAPTLDVGPEGSWDSGWVGCVSVLKEREDTYYLWYSGGDYVKPGFGIGLATGNSPVGPWTKHETNPIVEDFGYLGGVVKVDGKYYMYVEHPVGENSPDQGPFCLATADSPEGPWERYEGNPVLSVEGWGTWEGGGYAEAGVLYHEGVFHTLYSGTIWENVPPGVETSKPTALESIAYAFSLDGKQFHKHPANPVVMRERCPDTAALSEVHALFEPPLFYAYHTIRYISRAGEDLGVQVLATSVPFRFDMPVMTMDRLAAGAVTELDACPPIGLENINTFSLTAECSYDASAKAGLRVKAFASCDGLHYDTDPMVSFDNAFESGQCGRKTVAVDPMVKFAKMVLENLDGKKAIGDVKVIATLGCT